MHSVPELGDTTTTTPGGAKTRNIAPKNENERRITHNKHAATTANSFPIPRRARTTVVTTCKMGFGVHVFLCVTAREGCLLCCFSFFFLLLRMFRVLFGRGHEGSNFLSVLKFLFFIKLLPKIVTKRYLKNS